MFSIYSRTNSTIQATFRLLSANALDLDDRPPQISFSGKKLNKNTQSNFNGMYLYSTIQYLFMSQNNKISISKP